MSVTLTCAFCQSSYIRARADRASRFCTPKCRRLAWQRDNREEWLAGMRESYRRKTAYYTRRNRARRIGCSMEEIDAVILAQGDTCGSCGADLNGKGNVDHDHATKVVRGLICTSCNNMLGKHGDSVEKLKARAEELKRLRSLALAAIAYLEDPPGPKAIDRAFEEIQA